MFSSKGIISEGNTVIKEIAFLSHIKCLARLTNLITSGSKYRRKQGGAGQRPAAEVGELEQGLQVQDPYEMVWLPESDKDEAAETMGQRCLLRSVRCAPLVMRASRSAAPNVVFIVGKYMSALPF